MKQKHFYLILIILILCLVGALAYNISFRYLLLNNYPLVYQQYFGDDNHVIVIPLVGELGTTYSRVEGYHLDGAKIHKVYTDKIADFIREESKKEEVKGFIFEIDSVGGNSLAELELKIAIDEVEQPIISVVRGNALSSGIGISSITDYVFISPLSDIGDIGVVVPVGFYDPKGKGEDLFCYIPSNKFKNAYLPQCNKDLVHPDVFANEVKKATELALTGETQFIQFIADARDLSFEEVHEVANGKIMTGKEAVERKLADQLGNMNDALKWFEDREGKSLRLEFVREPSFTTI